MTKWILTAAIALGACSTFAAAPLATAPLTTAPLATTPLATAPLATTPLATTPSTAATPSIEFMQTHLQPLSPQLKVTAITATPVPNIYEVIANNKVIYVTADGKFAFHGDLLELGAQPYSLTSITEARLVKTTLATVAPDTYISFAPEKVQHTITVFTDVDCQYCRYLHKEVPLLNKEGIAVRYMAFPRTAPDTPAYAKEVSVWCAKDKAAAYADAMAGKDIPDADCDSPVELHHKMGLELGVTGTPVIILENGEMVRGYLPAKDLIAIIQKS